MSELESELLEPSELDDENPTRDVQKLVSFNDFPSGKSMMNFPKSLLSQKPALRASLVHTYVFC